MLKKKNEGFVIYFDDEKLKEYKRWSPDQILDWLDEANEFARMFISKEKRIKWLKIQKGEF